jgi:hypothetical protein
MRLLIALATVVLLTACGDNVEPGTTEDGSPTVDAVDDAAVDAPPGVLGPCVDRPDGLMRPPPQTGTLPCELLPPGFGQ